MTAGTLPRARKPIVRKSPAPAPRRQAHILHESLAFGNAGKVDRNAGIIFDVKICAKESVNSHGIRGVDGTDYTAGAFESALSLYEGLLVNIDHPPRDKPGQDRPARDRIGKLTGCYMKGGEPYAKEFRVLKTHPMAETLFEAAESMPDAFCLSHNAYGKGEVKGTRYVVTEIPEVRSVDVVAYGGTTTSLFESQAMKPKTVTLRELLEAMGGYETACKEMDDSIAAAPVPEEPKQGWREALANAIAACVKDEDEEAHDVAKKLLNILKPEAEAPAEVPEGDGPPADDEEDKEKDKKETKESREMKTKLAALERKDAVRTLCESLTFTPTPVQLKSLLALDNDKDRKELITEAKGAKPAKSGVRSQGATRPVQESAAVVHDDAAKFAGSLLR